MLKAIATLLALSTVLASSVASADCDYESHQEGTHNGVVPAYSYSHSFRSDEPLAYDCAREAEETTCEHTAGLECAREMQDIYATCVGTAMCDSWVQGILESGELPTLADTGRAFESCVQLVRVAGGND